MENVDPESATQLEAMGFTSFGQQHKKPKHHHDKESRESTLRQKLQKLPSSEGQPSEGSGAGELDSGFSQREKYHQNLPSAFVSQGRGQPFCGGDSKRQAEPYYSKTFIENPWEILERKMGILAHSSS